ncbi:hypothetical protein [Ensifer sp. 1H6]|uniref:hypothetical protein n=1 Tax=Ensifer sp. 1H6 TaxID=1911585 RepID=UPI001AECD919|nr:hypothetical protein [Ensifer sp. 1H6]
MLSADNVTSKQISIARKCHVDGNQHDFSDNHAPHSMMKPEQFPHFQWPSIIGTAMLSADNIARGATLRRQPLMEPSRCHAAAHNNSKPSATTQTRV